jgi:hypothetical protein
MLSTGQKIKNGTAKSLKTLIQHGLQVFCLESLLREHFKLFVLYLAKNDKIFTTKDTNF